MLLPIRPYWGVSEITLVAAAQCSAEQESETDRTDQSGSRITANHLLEVTQHAAKIMISDIVGCRLDLSSGLVGDIGYRLPRTLSAAAQGICCALTLCAAERPNSDARSFTWDAASAILSPTLAVASDRLFGQFSVLVSEFVMSCSPISFPVKNFFKSSLLLS
jgi:hypothetical protein